MSSIFHKIQRPLVFLDIETTSLEIDSARIVELAMVVVRPGTYQLDKYEQRFNPAPSAIDPDATVAHGITTEMLVDCPKFCEHSADVYGWLLDADLAGYNLQRFDIPVIDEELRRCGFKISMKGVRVIDASVIFRKMEPRTLTDAVRKYCGVDHTGAHSAMSDTLATLDVVNGQFGMYPEIGSMDMDALAAYCMPDQESVDTAGKLYRGKDGYAYYAFGKNVGKRVIDDVGYARWMWKSNFPASTKDALREEINRFRP